MLRIAIIGIVLLSIIVTFDESNTRHFTMAYAASTKPTVTITSPTTGSTISSGNLTVSGTASDLGSGVKSVLLYVNGSKQAMATPNVLNNWSTWTATLPFTISGKNVLVAQATDNAGYQSTVSIPVTVIDKTAPTITITSPTTGSTVSSGNLTVSGTASDLGSGVKSVQVRIGSGAYVTVTSSNNWSKWALLLPVIKMGSTTLTAKVIDNTGYQSTVSIPVTVIDKTAPTITIASPTTGSTVSAGNLTVSGTASDIGTGVKSIEMLVNGTKTTNAVPTIAGNWSKWTSHLLFSLPGSNTLVVRVTDNSNNMKTYLFPFTVADKTQRLSTSPSPTMFWFVVRGGFPDMTNLISLYQKHARATDGITEFTNSMLDSSVTTKISSTKSVTYCSISDLQSNAKTIASNGYKWILYDLEPSLSPANEVADPVGSVQQALQIAHSNGLKLLISPAQISQSYFQQMATYSDAYVLQAQDGINGDPTQFAIGMKSNINLIRTAHPNEIVILQGSTLKDTPSQIMTAYDLTYKMIDGFTVFYNTTSSEIPKMAQVFTHVDGIS